MSYHEFITVRMSGAMRAELHALAKERGTDAGKIVRQLIRQELAGSRDRAAEAFDQVLFLAIGMEGLLAAQPDQGLRARMIQIWRDRLAEKGRGNA